MTNPEHIHDQQQQQQEPFARVSVSFISLIPIFYYYLILTNLILFYNRWNRFLNGY